MYEDRINFRIRPAWSRHPGPIHGIGVSKFARLSLSPKGPVINYKGGRTGANEIYNAHFFLTLPQSDAHFCPTPLPPSAFLWFVPYNLNRHFLVCKTLCSLNN